MTESASMVVAALVAGARSTGPLELLAVALGFAYVVLAIRQRRSCWIAGGASTALYAVVFLEAQLYLQAMLQAAYVALAAYGWWSWRAAMEEGLVPAPGRWSAGRHAAAVAAVAAATAASAPLFAAFTDAAAPWMDSLWTWASLVATWMLARRVADSWLWWIVIDLGLALLLFDQHLVFSAALYLAYALLAVLGWRRWTTAPLVRNGA